VGEGRPVVNIVGERVALGPPGRELLPAIGRWVNCFETQRTLGDVPRPRTDESVTAVYERLTAAADGTQFAIYECAGWRPIGLTELQEIDGRHGTATFVIFIGVPEARGKGYGTEVTRLMLDYAFNSLGLHSVLLTVVAFNTAGLRAYARAGFREIGRRRQCRLVGGELWDDVYMECLASEFARLS
jgi:diamine N-acetyltransferase